MILEACTHYHSFDDRIVPISEDFRKETLNAIEDMAKDALRTLGLAYKNLNGNENMQVLLIIDF
jgi:Ca2+ transporting ATPase